MTTLTAVGAIELRPGKDAPYACLPGGYVCHGRRRYEGGRPPQSGLRTDGSKGAWPQVVQQSAGRDELVLSRQIVSAGTVAQAAGVTQRGVLALIADLGIRGRERYRAWGLI
jgi:hypothetical protein